MPKMFGTSRTYEMVDGKFKEQNKDIREKLMADQKKSVQDLIAKSKNNTFNNGNLI